MAETQVTNSVTAANRSGANDFRPVFIGGCGRSGSTMLGAMLGTHPDCLTTPEATFFFVPIRRRQVLIFLSHDSEITHIDQLDGIWTRSFSHTLAPAKPTNVSVE